MKPIIEVAHLIKRYKKAEKNALDDISFTVDTGEFFALLGPNGAGKTTIISILTTTLSKTDGQIQVAGLDIDRQASKIRQSIGIIFQNPSLDLNLTAEENIRFHCILYGIYPFRPLFSLMPEGYKKKVYKLAQVLGIKEEIFAPVRTFSGGMKRKLEIVRSLMHSPKILFLDEPTVGLDPFSRKNLWQYLKSVRREEKVTIFLTTHYLEEAESADNICIINHGKIVARGTPAKIKKKLIEEYLLLDAEDKGLLKKELKKLRLGFTQDGNFKINLDGKSAQEVISRIKTPLSMLKTHNPTLEEAYLEIVGEENNKV